MYKKKIVCECLRKGICENKCVDIFHKYKFYFAAENNLCTDYITEKYWQNSDKRFRGA